MWLRLLPDGGGEPPGSWAGKGAEALGLRGQVGGDKASADVMRALFHYGIGPDGVPLASRQRAPKYQARAVYAQIAATHTSPRCPATDPRARRHPPGRAGPGRRCQS